jgi:hypothetical protein
MVVPPPRLGSAAVVFFGQHGDISQHALQRGVSRQRLYREAHSVLHDLQGRARQQQLTDLRRQVADLQARLEQLQATQRDCVVLTPDWQAELASTAQAEGTSLPAARVLVAVLMRHKTPSVAQLGRLSRQAGLRCGPLLKVFDEYARPRARQGTADEIFFGHEPALLTVEPESLCWLGGRLAASRAGEEWAKELEQLPALEHLVRAGARGIENGLARVNRQRHKDNREPVSDQLDHFHTLREGGRALRKTQARAERAWSKAEEADRKVARQDRQGQARTGYATQSVLAWHKAEAAFGQWDRSEQAYKPIRCALRPFTAEGELNSRQKAQQKVEALLPRLEGQQWDKFKRLLQSPETCSYLDRLQGKVKELAIAEEVKEAVVASEGIRHNPQLVQGEGQRAAALRGLLLVYSVVIASAGAARQAAVQAVRDVGRASSCVEGLNSVVRMQQSRHRKMTQELLDLKRLYWNLRKFRTGRRKKTNPYQRLGVPLPPDLSWWQLLQLTPDQLRALLSAQPPTP